MSRLHIIVLSFIQATLLVGCGAATAGGAAAPESAPITSDSDGDGIMDVEDECVDEAEDMDGLADEDGCPETDFDGDGIPDEEDKCPMEPEVADGCPEQDGCPGSHCHPCFPGDHHE